MSEDLLIRHCAPTLAGLKTANMFTCEYHDHEEMCHDLRELNQMLGKKGIRIIPLRFEKGRALIYVYRPKELARDFSDQQAMEILAEHGYSCESQAECLSKLFRKLRDSETFPHEIGLFLGYPPEDVKGFIEDKVRTGGGNDGYECARCKCVGSWKVYGDEKAAREKFARYEKCRTIYFEVKKAGKPLEQLVVVK